MNTVSSVIGLFDALLTLYLSEGAMIATAILLLGSILVFFKSKGKKAVRLACGVFIAYSTVYLTLIAGLSFLFSSSHP